MKTFVIICLMLTFSCSTQKVVEKKVHKNSTLKSFLDEAGTIYESSVPSDIPNNLLTKVGEGYYGYKLKGLAEYNDLKLFKKSRIRLISYMWTESYEVLGIQSSGDVLANTWFVKRKKRNELFFFNSPFLKTVNDLKEHIINSESIESIIFK